MGEGKGLSMGLRGYHAFNPGVEFRQAFRWGLSGPYLAFTRVSTRQLEQLQNCPGIKVLLGPAHRQWCRTEQQAHSLTRLPLPGRCQSWTGWATL